MRTEENLNTKNNVGVELLPKYAAVQNGVILNFYPTYEMAANRIAEEKQKDFISIIFKRKLRKLFKKSGNIALHRYTVISIVTEEDLT